MENQGIEEIKRFAPEGALAYVREGGKKARWIYDGVDLASVRQACPEGVVLVRSRPTRAEVAAELLCRAGTSDTPACLAVAALLVGGRSFEEVFRVAETLQLADERRHWLARECATLKLRAQVFGFGFWGACAWLEVDSEEEGLQVAGGYARVDRCVFYRGDSVLSRYRVFESASGQEWRLERDSAQQTSGR